MEKRPDFKAMKKREVVEYVWGYYKWHFIIITVTVTMLTSLLYRFITYVDPQMSVLMINNLKDSDYDHRDGFVDFWQQKDPNLPLKEAVKVNTQYVFADDLTSDTNYQAIQAVVTLIASGTQELFFGTGEVFLGLAEEAVLKDLRTYLPEDILERYKDCLIYSTDNGESDRYPCAIELKDNDWAYANGYFFGCYVGVVANSDNVEVACEFVEFLLNK